MTIEQTSTIILLLILATCLLGVFFLLGIVRKTRLVEAVLDEVNCNQTHLLTIEENQTLILGRLSTTADRERNIKHALLEDGKLTRERVAQVKTRLADEERDDQRNKRRAHAKA